MLRYQSATSATQIAIHTILQREEITPLSLYADIFRVMKVSSAVISPHQKISGRERGKKPLADAAPTAYPPCIPDLNFGNPM